MRFQWMFCFQIFAFSVSNKNWHLYDWTKLTTVATFVHPIDPQLVCYAHSKGVRVVYGGGYLVWWGGGVFGEGMCVWMGRCYDIVSSRTFTFVLDLPACLEVVHVKELLNKA